MIRIGTLCVLLVVFTSLATHAQQSEPLQPPFRAGVSLVEVATVVTDRAGRAIGDLTAGDFEVFEDGQPRPVVSVRRLVAGQRQPQRSPDAAGDIPVERLATNVGVADAPAFVLVLDDLNTSPYDAHRVIRAGLGVLGAIPADALVAVVTTSGTGGSLLTLAPPGAAHAARVREFRGRLLLSGPKDRSYIQTKKSAVDAPCGVGSDVLQSQDCADPTRAARRAEVIDAVAQILGRAGSRRKVVFWVTEDMGVSPLDPQGNQAAQRAALQRVLNADVAVYPVNPSELGGAGGDNRPDRRTGGRVRIGPGDRIFQAGAGTTMELDTDDMVAVPLGQLARESGGRWITNANDLDRMLADVVEQNTTSYILAFEAAAAQTPGRHAIEVRVRRDGARVFARRGYVVPDTPAIDGGVTPQPQAQTASSLLRDTAFGSVPQGRLALTAQVVPDFAVGRAGRALVSVHLDAATTGDTPVALAVLSVDSDGEVGEQREFRTTRPEDGAEWTVTTVLPLARGRHQVRVAAVTDDGTRTGLVIVPVEIIEPGSELVMTPPVLLGGMPEAAPSPTLAREFETGGPIGLQVEVAGRPVRGKGVTVVATLQDGQRRPVREADAVLERGARDDRMRATAVVPTTGLSAGDYTLLVEARGAAGERPVTRAVPLRLRPATALATPASPRAAAPVLKPVAHGPSTSHPASEPLIIRDEQAWTAFWSRLPTGQPPLAIDFPRVTLLAFVVDAGAAAPVRPVVERTESEGDTLVVFWRTAPTTSAMVMPAGAPHRPFSVVGIIGHAGPIRFEEIK
jgi:VWFA-related protein